MKNFFYFIATILIIALIYAIWQFQTQTSELQDNQVELTTNEISTPSTDNCICNSECICPEDDTDCDCTQTRTICECTQENGEIATIESVETNNVDIEETNPDETADEDETVVSE